MVNREYMIDAIETSKYYNNTSEYVKNEGINAYFGHKK
jgi:hypothetical protein